MVDQNARPVWSSTDGDIRKSAAQRPPQRVPDTSGPARVRREIAGRRGKAVTTVANLPLDDAGLRELAGALKKRCGVGGSVKDGVIELQGDHRALAIELLRARGHEAVLAGG